MFKFTALLLFFSFVSSLLQENCAAQVGNTDEEYLAAALKQAVTYFFNSFESTGHNNHANSNQWMLSLLKQADEESIEHVLLAKIASFNDVTLTTELVSLADGFHLIIPSGELGVETEQRIEAIAIVNMLMNLKTMERTDTILANCTLYSTINVLFNESGNESLTLDKEKFMDKGREYIGKLFFDWLRSVTAVLENEPHLSEEFAKSKNEARGALLATGYANEVSRAIFKTEFLQPENTSGVERKLADKMFNSHLFRKMSLNRQFLKAASNKQSGSHKTKDKRRQFLFARALLDLAGQGSGQEVRVNEIYRKTLSGATESVSKANNMVDEIRDQFFDALEQEIEEDRDLAKRIKLIETKLEVWIAFRALRRSIAFI